MNTTQNKYEILVKTIFYDLIYDTNVCKNLFRYKNAKRFVDAKYFECNTYIICKHIRKSPYDNINILMEYFNLDSWHQMMVKLLTNFYNYIKGYQDEKYIFFK